MTPLSLEKPLNERNFIEDTAVFGRHASDSIGQTFGSIIIGVGVAAHGIGDALTPSNILNILNSRSENPELIMLNIAKPVAKTIIGVVEGGVNWVGGFNNAQKNNTVQNF